MELTKLYGTKITTSALGFGCSALLGDRTAQEALTMLAAAFDGGVRYFDVAPSYGQGRAEALLGQFTEKMRNEVVIATKFGIEPALPTVARSSFVRNIARRVMRISPGIRRLVGRASSASLARARFRREDAQRSLERSLRMLRTTYVDILLLHDCSPDDLIGASDLLEWLELMVHQGKVRCFGVGTELSKAAAISRTNPEFARVLQFANSVLISGIEIVQPQGAAVTYYSLSGSFTALREYLEDQPSVARVWSDKTGANCSDPGILSLLMLSHSIRANKRGPVLFSSRNESRIRENTKLLDGAISFSDDQIDVFATLAGQSGIHPV